MHSSRLFYSFASASGWYIFLLLFGLAASACASKAGGSTSGRTAPAPTTAALDFAKYRPKFEAPEEPASVAAAKPNISPTNHINNRLHPRLDSLAEANRNIRFAQGYRILVYSVNERQQAMDIRKAITRRLPEEEEYFTYNQPTFRLKIGDYLSRLEANAVLDKIRDIAPNAMVISEQVIINKPPTKKPGE